MKFTSLFRTTLLIAGFIPVFLLLSSCNTKTPYIVNMKSLGGYVICRETCFINAEKDAWVVDFTYQNNQEQVGDTMTINGIKYNNLVKVRGLDPKFQQPGLAIKVDYTDITSYRTAPNYCNQRDEEIFLLKEIRIIFQSELP